MKNREKYIKEFLAEKGFEWGESYDRPEFLDDYNIYYINLYDPQFKKFAHASISENSTTLHIQEYKKNLHEYGNEMEYNFSREWTLHLLRNVPEEKKNVLLDINTKAQNINNKMREDIEKKEFEINTIRNEAYFKIKYLHEIVDQYEKEVSQNAEL